MSDVMKTEKTEVINQNNNAMVNPELLLMTAIEKGLPIETIEKLLQLRTQLKNEWAKEQFENAMTKFQGECPIIQKIKEGGKTNSGDVAYYYAPIEELVLQTKDLILKNGFNYDFQPETLENKVRVTCNVNHISGYTKSKSVEFPLSTKTNVMSAPQVIAATMTFAMRYVFRFSFGIATGECENLINENEMENEKNIIQNIKNEIKNNKPNGNLIAQKFGNNPTLSNRQKIINAAGKIILPLNKADLIYFKAEFDYYLNLKESNVELTEIEYEKELNKLMILEDKIKGLHTGAVNDTDPQDVEFYLGDKKNDNLPNGVL
jgi:hypothetical protein